MADNEVVELVDEAAERRKAYKINYEIKTTLVQQIRDLFSTPKGSLLLDPEYGFDFDIIDTDVGSRIDLVELGISARKLLQKYVPRVDAENAIIKSMYNANTGVLAISINGLFISLSENPNAPVVQPS